MKIHKAKMVEYYDSWSYKYWGWDDTCCGKAGESSITWKPVTCKLCLKHKPKEKG